MTGDWNSAGMSRIASSHPKLQERHGKGSLSALQKEPILLTLELELVAFRMVRTLISVLILDKIFKKKKSLFPVGISLSFLPILLMYLEAEGCFR